MNEYEQKLAKFLLESAAEPQESISNAVTLIQAYSTLCAAYKTREEAGVITKFGTPNPRLNAIPLDERNKKPVPPPLVIDPNTTKDDVRACFRAKVAIIAKLDNDKQSLKHKYVTDMIKLMGEYGSKSVTQMDSKHIPEFFAKFKLLGPQLAESADVTEVAASVPEGPESEEAEAFAINQEEAK